MYALPGLSICEHDLFYSFQCWGWHQALRHLQDGHRLRICWALQSVLIPQRPGSPLQKHLLGPTQWPAECKSSLPCTGPFPEPEPAPQMNYTSSVGCQPGWGNKCSLVHIVEKLHLLNNTCRTRIVQHVFKVPGKTNSLKKWIHFWLETGADFPHWLSSVKSTPW